MNVYGDEDLGIEDQQFEFKFGDEKAGPMALRICVEASTADKALEKLKEAMDRIYTIDPHDSFTAFEICLNPAYMTVGHIVDSEEHAS